LSSTNLFVFCKQETIWNELLQYFLFTTRFTFAPKKENKINFQAVFFLLLQNQFQKTFLHYHCLSCAFAFERFCDETHWEKNWSFIFDWLSLNTGESSQNLWGVRRFERSLTDLETWRRGVGWGVKGGEADEKNNWGTQRTAEITITEFFWEKLFFLFFVLLPNVYFFIRGSSPLRFLYTPLWWLGYACMIRVCLCAMQIETVFSLHLSSRGRLSRL